MAKTTNLGVRSSNLFGRASFHHFGTNKVDTGVRWIVRIPRAAIVQLNDLPVAASTDPAFRDRPLGARHAARQHSRAPLTVIPHYDPRQQPMSVGCAVLLDPFGSPGCRLQAGDGAHRQKLETEIRRTTRLDLSRAATKGRNIRRRPFGPRPAPYQPFQSITWSLLRCVNPELTPSLTG